MKASFIYIVSFVFCFVSGLQAQTFSSRKLTEIGELFPKTCLPVTDSIFNCPQIANEKSFTVRYNTKNEIEHLGISLFSPETKELINQPVCDFIERLLLELALQKTQKDVVQKLKQYKIAIQINGVAYENTNVSLLHIQDDLRNPVCFSLTQNTSEYIAYWELEKEKLFGISFPASRELIYGTDKKESDDLIGKKILDGNCDTLFDISLDTVTVSELVKLENSDVYKHKGNILLIDQINSDTYYQLKDSVPFLVFNSDYIQESLANLFITKNIDTELKLKITHRMYGGVTPEFVIPLSRFLCLFNDFETYCLQYHHTTSDLISFSVILHNKDFSFVHLLRLKTTKDELVKENGVLEADFYTNMPLHNVKNLFK